MGIFDEAKREIRKEIESARDEALNSKFKKDLAKFARLFMQKRIRGGFGVDSEDSVFPKSKRLNKLSDSYKKRRRKLVKRGFSTGDSFSPNRSNLTLTGQLINSITESYDKNSIILTIPDSRRSDGKTNEEVHGYVNEGGRPFFAVTSDEEKLIEDKLRKRIESIFSKRLK